MDTEVSSLTDEQLAAMLPGSDLETETDTTTDEVDTAGDTVEQTDAEPPAEPVITDEQLSDPNWKPEGPGDLRVALKKSRESEQAQRAEAERIKAEAEQVRAEAAELRAYRQQVEQSQNQARTQQQAEQYRQQLAERLEFVDGQEAAAIVEEIRRIDASEMQRAYQAHADNERLQFSASVMADAHPDFAEHLQRAYDEFGPALDQLALIKSPNNPAKWAYELGKRLGAESGLEARIAAEVEKRLGAAVQEVLQKQKPPDTQGHRGIAHLSSEGGSKTVTKSPAQMTDAELQRALGY